jgi:hypothetical protein
MKINKLYRQHKILLHALFWIIAPTIILLVAADYYYNFFDLLARGKTSAINGNTTIDAFHAIELVILTAILVVVAWVQLESLKKTARADFLMRLDDRYGSEPIIKARQIIQRLYRESNNTNPGAPEITHRYFIGNRINEISEDISRSEDYVYLLNLLDFLESISFFANRNDITSDDIRDLMGLSLDFFYTIFKPRIEARRNKYKDKSVYSEFEKLVQGQVSP